MEQTAPPTPQTVFETITAYQRSAAMKTAVELDIFTKIAEGNRTAENIAAVCDASPRGIRILCDALTVLGFLSKENRQYNLTDVSAAFLNRHSPAFFGSTIEFLLSPMQKRGFENLTEAVRKGGAVETDNAALAPDSEMWVKFARGMMSMMAPTAQVMAEKLNFAPERKLKVLDVAAGHGIFGITVAQKYPNAEIYAVDWANVLQVATENAQKFGVAVRHHLIEGSAFDVEYGGDYDVVLLTNFLHHFDKQTCENLLRKINQSLAVGGKVLTLEFIPNDDRVSPPMEAIFSLVMLAGTPAGDAYTFAELKEMFENANFTGIEHISLAPMPQHLVVSVK